MIDEPITARLQSLKPSLSWPGGGGARRFFIVPVELNETIEDASEMIDDVLFMISYRFYSESLPNFGDFKSYEKLLNM